MKLARIAVDRPVTIYLFYFAVILLGAVSLRELAVDLLPDISYPRLSVITTVLFFLTPIVYPPAALPEAVRQWLFLNPLTGLIGTFRAGIGLAAVGPDALAVTGAVTLAALFGGGWVFGRRAAAVRDLV